MRRRSDAAPAGRTLGRHRRPREIAANGGEVGAGIVAAARWVAAHLPLYAINLILTTPRHLWALRYPQTHELLFLERASGGHRGDRHLDAASAAGTVRVRSAHLARRPAVILASEPMDESPGWTALESGELLHVGPDLAVERQIVLPGPPAKPLTLADLDPRAAASQQHAPAAGT
jgi:predicted glutamine amidotransferase